jgi:hypothetical protein
VSNPTTIPATEALLAGYAGPVLLRGDPCVVMGPDDAYPGQWLLSRPDGWDVMSDTTWCRAEPGTALALNLLNPIALDWTLRHLAAGVKCPACMGDGRDQRSINPNLSPSERRAFPALDHLGRASCPRCNGTGYLRQPAPAWHLRDTASGGTLTALVAAEAVAWSVVSVGRGGGVLRGVLDPWRNPKWSVNVWMRTRSEAPHDAAKLVVDDRGNEDERPGWMMQPPGMFSRSEIPHGPETGPLGRAAADAASLTAGFGLLNPDGTLTLPATDEERGRIVAALGVLG